uniref:Uncharacterized protein n=1 Tax=Anguilla anguilla TaxID=7936 RepID=A0A0E9T0C2_ANGAN
MEQIARNCMPNTVTVYFNFINKITHQFCFRPNNSTGLTTQSCSKLCYRVKTVISSNLFILSTGTTQPCSEG